MSGLDFSDPTRVTLDEAREWLRDRVNDGVACPCCTQFAKVYVRAVTSTSAWSLIRLYRAAGLDFAHWPSVIGRKQADEAKLVYWGLVEEKLKTRDDGGRAGWWRVTAHGERWIWGDITIPKYARIYDGRCLGLHGDQVTINDALGEKFRLDELMGISSRP